MQSSPKNKKERAGPNEDLAKASILNHKSDGMRTDQHLRKSELSSINAKVREVRAKSLLSDNMQLAPEFDSETSQQAQYFKNR